MRSPFSRQLLPLLLTGVVFVTCWGVLTSEIVFLNLAGQHPIQIRLLWPDILIGLTVYLKTSIDFCIFIGHLMRVHPGMKGRIAIECGTAVGNALGTMIILAIWSLFRQVDWVLMLMVLLASLVLLRMAEDGLEHASAGDGKSSKIFHMIVSWLESVLHRINRIFAPMLSRLVPGASLNVRPQSSWLRLLFFSASIPFVLGLDDFAGYVPLFSVIHIYGFAVGVLLGHMLLNIALFVSPGTTIRLVKQPIISLIGSVAFVGLAVWGLFEAWQIAVQYLY